MDWVQGRGGIRVQTQEGEMTAKEIKFTNVSIQKKYGLTELKTKEILDHLLDWKIIQESHSTSAYITYEVIKNPYE